MPPPLVTRGRLSSEVAPGPLFIAGELFILMAGTASFPVAKIYAARTHFLTKGKKGSGFIRFDGGLGLGNKKTNKHRSSNQHAVYDF